MENPTTENGNAMAREEALEIMKFYDPVVAYPPEVEAGLEEAARVIHGN